MQIDYELVTIRKCIRVTFTWNPMHPAIKIGLEVEGDMV
jgi:hypothetical protein